MTGLGRLAGKRAIVTGAARGMGAETARRFVEEGASVVIVDRRDELGTELAHELDPSGSRAVYASADVTVEDDWARVADVARERLGGVDVLVNNAGIIRVLPLLETDLELFRKVLDTNLVSVFLGMRTIVPLMQQNGGGSIINVSSPQGIEGRMNMAAYTASKFGVRGLTRTAAIELGPLGIRVNCVIPGPVRTAMTERKGWTDEDYDRAYGNYPLGRMGRPDEVANVSVFLASDESSFCTGADFVADGGVLAGKPRE
ncbi:MAG TPA: glucose 1-dehydrogenase [Acidimicrobiales bacterium]